jgi:flagellar biosynthesis/type III secretory pathway M-ring protein FliF/YscJ
MDFVKAQLARIQQQLEGLSASQRMLTVALLAIMVGTLLWWAKYAGEPEMEPVLNQSMAAEEITAIKNQLDRRGIRAVVSGDKVLVPADRKFEALAELGESRALPVDTRTGFDEIISKMSPWDLPSKTERMWNEAKQRTLAQIIRRFRGVENATVLIDSPDRRSFTNPTEPSATVSITMRRGEKISPKQVLAAASTVSGAVAGLKQSRVTVVVDGMPFPVADKDSDQFAGGSDILEQRRASEKMYEEKIRQQLAFIPQVLVSVTVDLNLKTTHEQKHTVDVKNTLQAPTETTETTEETKSAQLPTGEPGVLPNVGLSVNNTGSGDSGTSSQSEKTSFMVHPSTTDTITKIPAGDATVTAATVRVPRSWFVNVYKARNPNAKDPDDASLAAVIDPELQRIRNDVKKCTGLKGDEDVAVETYMDVSPMYAMAVEENASPVTVSVRGHAKEIAIGALAVMSLFMVMMMVRKSVPAPVVVAPPEPVEPQKLDAGEELAGEVGEGDPLLDAMELDDDAIKTQQMLDQVSKMVKDNPDAAATLVKRWLNK